MDEALRIAWEMNERAWALFDGALTDLPKEEVQWRPLPQANSIEVIVRHVRIEAEWHLACLQTGALMPTVATPALQAAIDAVPLDFAENMAALKASTGRFHETLGTMTAEELRRRSDSAYGSAPGVAPHFLAYHQAMHLAMHCAQIRSIRNLYRTTRGEPARFFPDNPTYPRQEIGQRFRTGPT